MKITFTKEHISPLSDNSLYKPGDQADLRKGDQLVALGVAYEGWGEDPDKPQPAPPQPKAPTVRTKRPTRKPRAKVAK